MFLTLFNARFERVAFATQPEGEVIVNTAKLLWCVVLLTGALVSEVNAQTRPQPGPKPGKVGERDELRAVPRQEYLASVVKLQRALAEVDAASAALAFQFPKDGPPSPTDCFFHPWHPGCNVILNPRFATPPGPGEDIHPGNPFVKWVASSYAWDVVKCLYKGDVGGQGFETDVGMQKMLNCFKF
jgi:hypothetical protein